tara:strand:+ start:128 stop:283 length:156 start_codon:yes stop_codon:yes gene_type:complete
MLAIKILIALSFVSIIATIGVLITFFMLMKDIKGNEEQLISEQLKEILNRL